MTTPLSITTWEEMCERGLIARREMDKWRWVIGDLACEVETVWGAGRLADFARGIGMSKRSVERYRQMSLFYFASARTQLFTEFSEDVITWTHYREAMRIGTLARARNMLQVAANNGWTTDEIAVVVGKLLPVITWSDSRVVLGEGDGRMYLARDVEPCVQCAGRSSITVEIPLADNVSWADGKLMVSLWIEEIDRHG